MTVTTGEGVFHYRVEDIRYPGDSLPPPLKPNRSRLTLVTSSGGGWRSGWAPTHTAYLSTPCSFAARPSRSPPHLSYDSRPGVICRCKAIRAPWCH